MELLVGTAHDDMAAVRTLISGELPPVGQRVLTAGTRKPPPEFAGFRAVWTDSGTTALALAAGAAGALRRGVRDPRVLLPAYGCPDLVAAVLYAGAVPQLIDLEPDGPGFDAQALRGAVDADVAAIVAVNFLGIREDLARVNALAAAAGAVSIEDCAQWYPEDELVTDAAVLSFGRGKPVNLLGGGALLTGPKLAAAKPAASSAGRAGGLRLRAAAFNVLMHRLPYAWVAHLPGLGIGETRYAPLHEPGGLDQERLGRLRASASVWLQRDRWRERFLDDALSAIDGVDALPVAFVARRGRLLRYPVLLAGSAARDTALARLNRRGLGASAFYGRALPEIEGMPEAVRNQGPFPRARAFAERLLTLPLHDGVTRRDLEGAVQILEAACRLRERSR